MIYVTDFPAKTDSESFELALNNLDDERILIIPPRRSTVDPDRHYWLIDRAILLPEDITVIMRNSTIKLSDRCRDNFFRTANCGLGIEFPEPIRNVHIRGIGHCELQGADRPRSTGDSDRTLKNPCPHYDEDILRFADWLPDDRRSEGEVNFFDRHYYSFGTDAGDPNESQYGDWRNIGILFANVADFTVENIHLSHTHGWGMSFELCSHGHISHIHFDANMRLYADGMWQNCENEDGINLRHGCHHITVTDISGQTGDDLIALTTSIDKQYCPEDSLRSTQVIPGDPTKYDVNIHDIIIRNVTGYSTQCYTIRLLSERGAQVYNVIIDGVMDTPPVGKGSNGGILMGIQDDNAVYGEDDIRDIIINNVVCSRRQGVLIWGNLKDSIITNVRTTDPNYAAIHHVRENPFINVKVDNCCAASGRILECGPSVFEDIRFRD